MDSAYLQGDDRAMGGAAFSETRSLCPECLEPIPAIRLRRGADVYMRKTCAIHGEFEVVLWRGEPSHEDWDNVKARWHPERAATSVQRGCPLDCGLRLDHRQQTCTALLEVTLRCQAACAFYFARSDPYREPDPDMSLIGSWFESLLAGAASCNLQLSGGEPTLRNDLPEIVRLGRSMGFGLIQLDTNGLRLAADPRYVEGLKKAGLSSIFLQFDGTEDPVYRALRAKPLLESKIAAIQNCRAQEIGVVLVPTIVPGVNDRQLGTILQFALENLPTVRGVHFQPVSYFGGCPRPPRDEDRITIPEIVRGLATKTNGLVKTDQFSPPGCENARCSFHGTFVLMPDGELKAFSRHKPSACSCGTLRAEEGAERARRFVARQWRQPDGKCEDRGDSTLSLGYWDVVLERARTRMLSVSGMAFQDAWNVDIERLKDCCIHVVARDGRLVPFCAYQLTSSTGRALYAKGDRP